MSRASNSRFLDACRMQPTDGTPIWMMRQAGRSLPAYRELRSRYGFLDLIKDPELMARISLMPFEYLDVDAGIAFADIMLPMASLGIEFEITEGLGPVVSEPIRTRAQVDALDDIALEETCENVFTSITLAAKELAGKGMPLIGFSGAPFTLACYLVEGKGSREFSRVRAFMHSEPEAWNALMERLTHLVSRYLALQIEAGASAVQLFDSWIGVLSAPDAERFAMPFTDRIFKSLDAQGVPRINFGTGTGSLIEAMADVSCDVLGVDWRTPIDVAWQRIAYKKAIQGNLDPAVLLADDDTVRARAGDVLRRAGGRPGHIFNLGHGVLPDTPLDNLRALVDFVHEYRSDE